MPSTNAAAVVQPNDEKPPTSAAMSAGTMSAGSDDRVDRGLDRRHEDAEHTGDRRSTAPSWCRRGSRARTRGRTAPFSFSAAARVASPKRVHWNSSPQHDREHDDERRDEELLLVDLDESEVHLRTSSTNGSGSTVLRGDAESAHDDGLQVENSADRRDDLRERRRVAQRPEDEKCSARPEHDAEQQRDARARARTPCSSRTRSASGCRAARTCRPPNWCTTPSTSESGLGSGGRNRSPSLRRTV